MQQQNKWLVGLNNVASTINRHRETRPLLKATLSALMALVEAEGGQCLLLGDGQRSSILVNQNLESELLVQQEATDALPDNCLLKQVLELGAPLYAIGDGQCTWQRTAYAAGYRTMVAIPLLGRTKSLGVCLFYYSEEQNVNESKLQLLMIAGGQLATALERARLLEAERTQRKHIEAVQRASASVNRSLDLQAVLDSILTELAHVIEYDSAAIILRDEPDLLIAAAHGIPTFKGKQRITEQNNELSEEIARTRRPLILEDAQSDPRFGRWLHTDYVRGWMGIPLLVQERYIGHLTADSRQKGAYTQADAERALSFAQQAAIAVTNARLHEDVQAQLAALQQTQERLLQSEKLAAIGQLVSGVAHELNNPLGAIQLYGELVREKLGDARGEVREELQQILTQVQRANNIVETLLDFARQRPPVRQSAEINAIVTSTVELMRYELRTHNVSLDLALGEELPPIMADPQQIQQVMVNLINNAYQAMSQADGGGQLRISTETRREGSAEEIVITVSDSGPGIPEDDLARIFEPFYTTRAPGMGTGLGLSVCHGIVSEHRGRIRASNRPDRGATFSVTLPVEQASKDSPAEEQAPPARPLDGARILIADDEDSLRLAMEDILTLVGCEVEIVADGRAGMEVVAAAHPDNAFDLILCDVRMPGLAGPAFYRKLVAAYPHYRERVLFITGDRLNAETRRFLNAEDVPWLAKPFDMQKLMQRVSDMLQRIRVQEAGG